MSASAEKEVLIWGESLLGPLKASQGYEGALVKTRFKETIINTDACQSEKAEPKFALKSFLECLVDERNRNDDIASFISFLENPLFTAKLNKKEGQIVAFVVSNLKKYLSLREKLINEQWGKFKELKNLDGYKVDSKEFKEFAKLINDKNKQLGGGNEPLPENITEDQLKLYIKQNAPMSIDIEMSRGNGNYFLRPMDDHIFREKEVEIIAAINAMYNDEFIANQLLLARTAPYIHLLDKILNSRKGASVSPELTANVQAMIGGTSGALLCSQTAAKIPDLVKSVAKKLDKKYEKEAQRIYDSLAKSADKINQGMESDYIVRDGVILQRVQRKSIREAILKKYFRELLRDKIKNGGYVGQEKEQKLLAVKFLHLIAKLTKKRGKKQDAGLFFSKNFLVDINLIRAFMQKKKLTDTEIIALKKIKVARSSKELSAALQPLVEEAIKNLDPVIRAVILDEKSLFVLGLSQSNKEELNKKVIKLNGEIVKAQEDRDAGRIKALNTEKSEIEVDLKLIDALPDVNAVEKIKGISEMDMVQLWLEEKRKHSKEEKVQHVEEVEDSPDSSNKETLALPLSESLVYDAEVKESEGSKGRISVYNNIKYIASFRDFLKETLEEIKIEDKASIYELNRRIKLIKKIDMSEENFIKNFGVAPAQLEAISDIFVKINAELEMRNDSIITLHAAKGYVKGITNVLLTTLEVRKAPNGNNPITADLLKLDVCYGNYKKAEEKLHTEIGNSHKQNIDSPTFWARTQRAMAFSAAIVGMNTTIVTSVALTVVALGVLSGPVGIAGVLAMGVGIGLTMLALSGLSYAYSRQNEEKVNKHKSVENSWASFFNKTEQKLKVYFQPTQVSEEKPNAGIPVLGSA